MTSSEGQNGPMKDWVAWHAAYDDPASHLSARLDRVRAHLRQAIDQAPPGPLRLVSLCAGQGHDVIGVLPDHPRRDDVRAVLVESDPRNAEMARSRADAAGLAQLDLRLADASQIGGFADALPADILLLCGIFGNVSDADIRRTVKAAPALCAPGGTVIWTRHRRPPDLTAQIREWFAASGFDQVAFDALDTATATGVGVNRLRRPDGLPGQRRLPGQYELPGQALFTFRPASQLP
jgi:ubiquinone/menaquinone biosynthesis C-methylase UbiE